jgi:hypothetical protein
MAGVRDKAKLAIVGVRFTDRPHEQNFIEDYVNVSRGSGKHCIDILAKFGASRLSHPELASASARLLGHVGRRQFNYEVRRAWKARSASSPSSSTRAEFITPLLTSRATRESAGDAFHGAERISNAIS